MTYIPPSGGREESVGERVSSSSSSDGFLKRTPDLGAKMLPPVNWSFKMLSLGRRHRIKRRPQNVLEMESIGIGGGK
jgi:hypothetical protein